MYSKAASLLPFSSSSSPSFRIPSRHIILYLLLLLLVPPALHSVYTSFAAFRTRAALDVVYAHYEEDLGVRDGLERHVRRINMRLGWKFRIRNVVYLKGPEEQQGVRMNEWLDGQGWVDHWERLENLGREGGAYLHHIITHYPSSSPDTTSPSSPRTLADKTLFVQGHMAWGNVGMGRFPFISRNTGFLSLAPYRTGQCGHTDQGLIYPQMVRIWELFRGTKCPEEETQLVTWAGQFIVSRARILANPLSAYTETQRMLYAPPDDPIHNDTAEWFPKGDPSNPFFGHSLERSWGVIFDCNEPRLAEERCGTVEGPGKRDCQCFDGDG